MYSLTHGAISTILGIRMTGEKHVSTNCGMRRGKKVTSENKLKMTFIGIDSLGLKNNTPEAGRE